MQDDFIIEIKKSVEPYLKNDPVARTIANMEEKIAEKKDELIDLEIQLDAIQKRRPEVAIEYRKSIMWCLEIDSKSPYYFLKSKEGLVRCIEYKHKIKVTPQQNSAIGAVLSTLFKDGLIGRISHSGMFFYGLPTMFYEDKAGQLTILRNDYAGYVEDLRQVPVKI